MGYGTEERIKQLQAEIDRLRKEQQAPPVWVPEEGGWYYVPSSGGVSERVWYHDSFDKYSLSMGNVFKTEREAEDHARATKLIETIRRERFRLQGNWWSDKLTTYTICWDQFAACVDTDYAVGSVSSDVLGCWKDYDVLKSVIKRHEPELRWYFTEYLPSIN